MIKENAVVEGNVEIEEIIVTEHDEVTTLLGNYLIFNIQFWDVKSEKYIHLATMKVYLLDDADDDLIIQSDAHSQRLFEFMEDVNPISPLEDEEWYETLSLLKIVKEEEGEYIDGNNYMLADVCGRVAIAEDLQFETSEVSLELKEAVYNIVFHKLFHLFKANFILAKGDLYMPHDSEIPYPSPETEEEYDENQTVLAPIWKQTANELKDYGFVETGRSTYVIKDSLFES